MKTVSEFEQCWTPEPFSGCWLWTRGHNGRGYGYACPGKGKHELAHRMSWRLHKGDIPAGLHVLHRCDTTLCVNPDHLFLGTRSDNMRDAKRKGRFNGGVKIFSSYPNPPRRKKNEHITTDRT